MKEAVKDLLLKMADDALILGHRNSEWTGLGPVLEEDIAFSSMAQDKIGHARALYLILHEEYGEPAPDKLAYERSEKEFRCCHLTEMPNGEYDYSLVRHFFFDHAEICRYKLLEESSEPRLAALAKKIHGELKYHVLHADTWMKKLATANEESRARILSSVKELYPYALGIFEKSKWENDLIKKGVFTGEQKLQEAWISNMQPVLDAAEIKLPVKNVEPVYGGRNGFHTEHLKPLLEEMTEVYRLEPGAEW
jgi:ring-1,2-phenylacetyl-CoA epoxidase subunit PaaC